MLKLVTSYLGKKNHSFLPFFEEIVGGEGRKGTRLSPLYKILLQKCTQKSGGPNL